MSPTIYLTALLGIIISLLCSRIYYNKWLFFDELFEFLTAGITIGFSIGIIIWLLVGSKLQPELLEYQKEKRYLVALKDSEGIHGNFFLGCGSFGSNMEYYGYENIGESRYKMVKFPNNSIIVEDIDSLEQSYFIEIREMADSTHWAWEYEKWMIGPFEIDGFIRWEIHIPKGSVLKDSYELDLE